MNEDQNKFAEARSYLIDCINSEFVGPNNQDILTENPVTRYAAGILYPIGYEGRNEGGNEDPPTNEQKLDGEVEQVTTIDDAENESPSSGLANSFFPSVLGLSFYSEESNPELAIELQWTTYRKIEPQKTYVDVQELSNSIQEIEEFKNNFKLLDGKLYVISEEVDFELPKIISEKANDLNIKSILEVAITRFKSSSAWVNTNNKKIIEINYLSKKIKVIEGIELICERKQGKTGGPTLFTIAVKNTFPVCSNGMDEEHVFFNVSMSVTDKLGAKDVFTEYSTPPFYNSDE